MEQKIKNLIQEALKSLEIVTDSISLEHPVGLAMGDYSTNVAMASAKNLKSNPKELAQKIVEKLRMSDIRNIGKIEVAGPGFINFYLSREFFTESIKEILENKDFGKNESLAGKKVMVEYTDPNPFKPFHIGHLMSNAIGESVARLVEYSGAETVHAIYQGDVGPHVAKALWAILKKGKPDESLLTSEKADYIGVCYSEGATAYEDDPEIKKEIDEINKKVYERSHVKINEAYDWGRRVTLEAFEGVYKKLGSKFEHYFFESEMAPIGKKVVLENTPKVFTESDGAVVFKGEEHDAKLHTRVFINSQGLPTYEAKEIGLTMTKFEKVNPDMSIVITAIEQGDYMRVVQKAISLIHPDYEVRMKHVTHGMLRFATGKMSSRKGNVITGESLIKDVSDSILEKIKDRDFTDEEREIVANQVGVAALKYSILKQGAGSDVIYDFEKSISFEGDSGPYMQYSYARTRTLVAKAKKEGIEPSTKNVPEESTQLEKMLYRFPEVVARASREFEPHYVANYLIELSRMYNSFYGNTQIINKEDATSPYKVALTDAFSKVMGKGLWLLGIEVPEKM
ncbi:MAG: arginine--tRNA ligase [bacterium]|nr:arginine--tRNA ligase [bacterium]